MKRGSSLAVLAIAALAAGTAGGADPQAAFEKLKRERAPQPSHTSGGRLVGRHSNLTRRPRYQQEQDEAQRGTRANGKTYDAQAIGARKLESPPRPIAIGAPVPTGKSRKRRRWENRWPGETSS